ncbi:putative adaptor protein complex, sigma subunit [Helianthus annuus]|nr:putative adaptor protein complex, sigma subunit [Helianthus annuus]
MRRIRLKLLRQKCGSREESYKETEVRAKDTADIPPSNPHDPIDLESNPERLVRKKAGKRKQTGAEAEGQPAKKVQRKKITRRGNLDAFISEPVPGNSQSDHRSDRIGSFCCIVLTMIHFVLLISRQGKVRLTKWYSPYSQKERSKVIRELSGMILTRGPKLCNFVEWRGFKVVYKRYASLYFCMCINQDDNELEILEIIHHFVEILDRYFGSVCELDLIFSFQKAYYMLDEILIAGELQESSKKTVARLVSAQDSLVEAAKEEANSISNIIAQATK